MIDYAGLRRLEGLACSSTRSFFLIVSLIAGVLGLTNVSQVAKRVSMVLFAMFFLVFLALMGFAYLASEAIDRPALPLAATVFA